MIGNKRHRARSAAAKLMVVGLALLMVAGIWLHNVLGLRESVLDFVEGVVVAGSLTLAQVQISKLHQSLIVQAQAM